MKILILVPDGVGVRNYLYSNFTDYLIEAGCEVIIFHKLSNAAIKEIKNHKPKLNNFLEIPDFLEVPKTRILRESLAYARLLINKKKLQNNTILKFWNPSKKTFKKKILYVFSESLGFIMSKNFSILKFGDRLFEKEIKKSSVAVSLLDSLKKIKPDFVLNLHQRAPITSPLISSAKKMGIKTATVIFSWDNVPKARLISRYDYYFVWSDLMKNQLTLLYEEIFPSQIIVTGTPQFEFYFNTDYSKSKNEFFSNYGLDPNKKTICFSGNDLSSPYEANYLRDICEEVTKIVESERPQIIFRRCPVDKSNRFDSILEDYKNLVFSIDPDWKTEKEKEDSFASIYPTFNDNSILINTILHSDLIINLASTMAHDAAVLNKPCIYLNYNPVKNPIFKVEDVFEFEHFKSMQNIEAVGWINNKNEIKSKILETIEFPSKIGKERKQWLEKIVQHPLDKNSINLANLILEKCTSAS